MLSEMTRPFPVIEGSWIFSLSLLSSFTLDFSDEVFYVVQVGCNFSKFPVFFVVTCLRDIKGLLQCLVIASFFEKMEVRKQESVSDTVLLLDLW